MGLLYSPASRDMAGASRETPLTPSESALDDRPQFRLRQIGNPIWKPVDLHLFSAPIGPPPEFPLLLDTAIALLNPSLPENHSFHDDLFVGPGNPHGPPYNREFRNGVARLGFDEDGPFAESDFSGENAVWLTWMTVPKPGTQGSSPDFDSGPIIPNLLFLIQGPSTTTRNGAPFGMCNVLPVPPLDTISPRFDVDGHSHFPVFYLDGSISDPAVDTVGSYTYQILLVDKGRLDGWWRPILSS